MRSVLASLLVVAACLAAGDPVKRGVERWTVKTSGPDAKTARQVALADLLTFAEPDGVSKDDSRYQKKRIEAKVHGNFQEGQLITTTGYLHLIAGEGDGDYHIQISASPDSGDHCLIVEVPFGDPDFVTSPELRPQFDAVRAFLKEKTLAGKDPSPGGSILQHPPYVTVTGVLFYDDSHVGDPPRGKKGMKAATLWELHPVTAVAFAPKPH
jgi:hypothetical protein